VSASDGTYSDKVAVTWNASSGATAYEVWRHTSNSSGAASKIADPTGTSYDDTTAVAGTTYYYWVKAKNAGGTSGFSSSDSGYRQIAPPVPPTGVSASDGTYSDKVAVTWNASSGATAYEVWRHTSNSSGAASKIADPTGTSYDDTTAVAGTTYYYWVKAKNAGGTSGFSSSDSGYRQIAPPVPPTGVSASDGTYSDKVAVTWNASSGATAYEVWRHTSNSSGAASKIADPTGTSYDDTTAVAGTTYYYWVKAKNAGGTSGFSSSDSGYRQIAPPVPPTGVSASDGTYSDKVAVTWNASSGATAYEVWRHTSNSSGAASKIADPTGTSYDDTTAVAGTTYYYWVKAKNAGGTSGFSSSDSGYRQSTPSEVLPGSGGMLRILSSGPSRFIAFKSDGSVVWSNSSVGGAGRIQISSSINPQWTDAHIFSYTGSVMSTHLGTNP
jgi:fibronectin type 3 domain-containing protein